MNKISLVSRRRDQRFDSPTRASLRARERFREEALQAEIPDRDHPDSINADITVGFERGAPTVEVEVPSDQRLNLEDLASEYLGDNNSAEIRTEISKERIGDKWGLKIQFMPDHTSRMLSTKELALMLGVSSHTIYKLRKANKIKGYKAGTRWRYIWTEVLAALEGPGGE